MDRKKQEKIMISTSHQTTGTQALRNFTIPRKKRTSGEVVLERCPKESRDYTVIQSKLRDSRLDTGRDPPNTWIWKDVHLVQNDKLLQRFSEKRAEMRAKGRHGREMEERFCFLVVSDQDAIQIYQDGLKVGSSFQYFLGKPTHGVYLFRYVDVALKSTTSLSATNLLIFKVLYGKVKRIPHSLTWKKSQDPVIGFDCHMSKDVVSPRDALHQQILGSSVFLFDFKENQELNESPRQCLPYALVSFASASNVYLGKPLNLPLSSTSHADRFRTCTVGHRGGKGDTANITFKHFCKAQNPKDENRFHNTDVQNPQAPDSQQHRFPISQNLILHQTNVSQSLPQEEENHKQNTAGTQEKSDICDTIPQGSFDKLSTIVYSSNLVRDPRLSRREQSNLLEAETSSCLASRSDVGKWSQGLQNQDANDEFVTNTTHSGPIEPSKDECPPYCSFSSVHTQLQKTETLPSIKLFKMKFQKYAKYFSLNEEERHKKVWALEMLPEQKQGLLDRIHFYEEYYQKHKKGLLTQKFNGVETENTSSLSLIDPQENHATQTQSEVSQTINSEAEKAYVDHLNDCLVQSPEILSQPFLEVGSLNLNSQIVQAYHNHPASSSCALREGKTNDDKNNQSEPFTDRKRVSGIGNGQVDLIERCSHESLIMFDDNITAMDTASFVEVSSYGVPESSNPNSKMTKRQKQAGKIYSNIQRNFFLQDSISLQLNMATIQDNTRTHKELYQRLQFDELFPSQNSKRICWSRAYLTPRVTPTDTRDQSKTLFSDLRCWNDPHLLITLKADKAPAYTLGTSALSERFSKLKSLQKIVSAFVNKYNRTGSSNVELIKLLAKRYNYMRNTKFHSKYKSLNKSQTSALVLGRSLRTKYCKKKHFQRAKKSICTNVVSIESSHEAEQSTVISDNPTHTSKINLTGRTDREQDPPSDVGSPDQQLHMQVSQKTNAITNILQDNCSPINDLLTSIGLKTSSETREERTKPTEPLSLGTDVNKPTDEVMVVMMNEVEKDRISKNTSTANETHPNKCHRNKDNSLSEEGSVLQEVTSHMAYDLLGKVELNTVELPEDDFSEASKSTSLISHPTNLLTPECTVMCNINDKVETQSEADLSCDSALGKKDITETSKNQCGALTETNSQVEVLIENGSVPDFTGEKSSSSGQCERISDHSNSIKKSLLSVAVSDTKHANPITINEKIEFSRPERNQNYDIDSAETQLISKLRDYLTKFETTVKKQETVNEGAREKPVVWITLDSTAHKQQLAEKGQYRSRPVNEAQTRPDVYLLVPAESKRGRFSQTKRSSRHRSKKPRWSSCPSVSPDSTSALDMVKQTSPQPLVNPRTAALTEISLSEEPTQQLTMNNEESRVSIICSQDPVDTCGNSVLKAQTNQALDPREIADDGDVSSSFSSCDFSVSDISNTLKMADQTSSLAELGSLRLKCKNMLQNFILRFDHDQKVPFNQSFVSRNLILQQYLDHPPAHVDLKYEAVNSYLELQMMMEAWQFVMNKINFLKGKPTFRSLLWYDSSLYGELYKGEVGFQQQSSLFSSFQKMLVQEGYAKLHEYYMTVSRMYQQLLVNPDASYYMYLKSKREVLEIEAALRNPNNVKFFFLSVPLSAMINFGDSLESLENMHKVIMSFVETPSDQLPGTFDVGKAEHLSITCRYLQEKAFFIRSCKEMLTKVSWFGIEHLLYDASKILIWQDKDHGVSNEVLKMNKNSNPQIIFGVTESGVSLVNKVGLPRLSLAGAERSAEKQTHASQKHKPSQSSDVQTTHFAKKVDYSMSEKRETPVITSRTMNDNGANLMYQTPSAHAGSSTPSAHPYHENSSFVDWRLMSRNVHNWNPPSASHIHSEIKSLPSKRRVSSSHSDQRVQTVREQKWPAVFAPQTTSQADYFVTRPVQQTSTASHCPVSSKEQANCMTLAMEQPFSLPNFPLNANLVAPCSMSVPNSLNHIPVTNMLQAINYPYFLLNGQTYTTDSTAAINHYTRYYSNTF